jgi:SAM-dependent methyltransferase
LWHHDYLHLRPIARELERRVGASVRGEPPAAVLDLGCGASPYRRYFGAVGSYVRVDLDRSAAPDTVARAEALPFADAAFDHVLSTQLLQLTDDPAAMGAEVARVVRPGGRAWVTVPAGWPYDAARHEHRFGAPDLPGLFAGLDVVEVVRQGGMLAMPSSVVNLAVREAVRAAERRAGPVARILRLPAALVYVVSNAVGRSLEVLAGGGLLAPWLGFLDARLPMNFLVVAERPR